LTARLHGARKGKKKSKDSDLGDSQEIETKGTGKGKERATEESDREKHEAKGGNEQPYDLSSVPTISVSTDQVESEHGTTRIVTPDLTEPPPPLTVPSPFDSPALSTHSSNFDPHSAAPPPRIKVNENDLNDDKGPSATTFATSQSLSDLSDDDDDSSRSLSDDEENDDAAKSDSESLNVVSRSDSQPDPRELLRSQLARAGNGRNDGRSVEETQEERKGEQERRMIMNRTVSGMSQRSTAGSGKGNDPEKRVRSYEKRRYFILSTAGKLVYTS
jgi:hypothetical protein